MAFVLPSTEYQVYLTQKMRENIYNGVTSKNVIKFFSFSDGNTNYQIKTQLSEGENPDVSGVKEGCITYLSKDYFHKPTVVYK